MKDLIIIGAGDFGREVANVVERINEKQSEPEWQLLGFVDDDENLKNNVVDGLPVLGPVNLLNQYTREIFAVCSLGVSSTRKKVIEKITNPFVLYATLIDPDARIYKGAEVSEGSIICGGSILAINTKVGKHVVVNLNCTLGHDDVINDYCVINPGVNVSGKVTVGPCSDLGTGSKVIQGLRVCPEVTVGAGGVVIRDLLAPGTYVGVPAKMVIHIS